MLRPYKYPFEVGVNSSRSNWIRIVAGVFILLVVIPLVFRNSSYSMTVLINAAILGFISLGVWLTFSIGRINISQGAFALIGGYIMARLSTRFGVPFWLCLIASGVGAALIGALIGWPILRLRGVYFSMLTLSLTEATRLFALNASVLTGGASGILNIPTPFQGENSYLELYLFSMVLLILGTATVWRITTTRLGWVFRALRQDEALASSIGINIEAYRVLAFSLCCGFGGMGGALLTVFVQSIYPTSFTVTDSTNFMLYCFLGGLGSVFGPALGALVLFLGFQLLSPLEKFQPLAYAVIMILAMLVLPNGLLSLRLPKRVQPREKPVSA
jgi:branched-chain amino acid transport system permease protein